MRSRITEINCLSGLLLIYLCKAPIAFAQVVQDQSLPTPTQVNLSGNLIEIREGTVAGQNLFHSFNTFSVLDGQTARFINNSTSIQNVIGRITGQSISEIFGRIESGGLAPSFNLFLINPNGVVFGPQASLDIRGSFLVTTANSIQFGAKGLLSVPNANDPSILTIDPSSFIFNQIRPGNIINQGKLEVPSGNSLILLGGDVLLDGGILNAPNGKVDLGGLKRSGNIDLSRTGNIFNLGFPSNVARANVSLENGSVNVIGSGSGSIAFNAQNIAIKNSSLSAGIAPKIKSTYIKPGEIVFDASDSFTLDNSFVSNFTNDSAVGNSGSIFINAGSVNLSNQSFIASYTGDLAVGNSGLVSISAGSIDLSDLSFIASYTGNSAVGNSGLISINASSIDLSTQSSIKSYIGDSAVGNSGPISISAGSVNLSNQSFIASYTGESAEGNSGYVSINAGSIDLDQVFISSYTGYLAVGNSGSLSVNSDSLNMFNNSGISTYSFGNGNTGDITIKVYKGFNISGSNTGVATALRGGGEGNSGTISISSGWLSLSDGAIIRSTVDGTGNTGNISIQVNDFVSIDNSNNQGDSTQIRTAIEAGAVANAGNIDISARTISLTNGGQLSSAVLGPNTDQDLPGGEGNGGNINVHTSDSVTISGVGDDGFSSGIFADTELGANGPAGKVEITTNLLTVNDGAEIKISNPQGQAGSLTANVNRLLLNNGKITTETGGIGSSNSANIDLKVLDLLQIENESLISAKATDNASGGNIKIDTPILLAFPPVGSEGSDIRADAGFGKGGKITINAQGVFGIQQRKATPGNQTNDISASSDFGQSGQVQINTSTDPNQGLVELPATVIDPRTLVAQNPCRSVSTSEFTRSGRGGLPPSLSQDLSSQTTQVGLVEPTNLSASKPEPQAASKQITSPPLSSAQIAPARGWVYNDKGEVVLVAYNSAITGPQRLQSNPKGCPVL